MFSIQLGENLELRLPHENDAPELFDVTDRNREYLRQWLPWLDVTKDVDSSRAFIKQSLKGFADNNGFSTFICLERKIIGVVGFHQIDWANGRTEIGYWLDEFYQGRGIVTRACKALTAYGFDELKLNAIRIRCASANTPSRAIPKRLGFTHEGTAREFENLYGVYHDSETYCMLAKEWRESQG